jgi:hypothetical protein
MDNDVKIEILKVDVFNLKNQIRNIKITNKYLNIKNDTDDLLKERKQMLKNVYNEIKILRGNA